MSLDNAKARLRALFMAEPASDYPPIIDYTDSDYQTSFWEQGDRAYEDRVEAIALRRLLPEGGRLLLEIGAGAGRNTPRYHGFERIVLLDYSKTQLEQAQARLGQSERYVYVAADAYRLPFVPGLFDTATMIRTIHHMAEPQRALAQVREALQAGGIFILEYANKQNLKAILRYLGRRQAWNPFDAQPVEFAELNFDFHPRAMRAWLRACQFRVQRQLTVSHFRMATLKRHVPTGWLVRLDSLIQFTGGWCQLSPSVFVRAQAMGDSPAAARVDTPGAFFRCPACGHYPIAEGSQGVHCASCGRLWCLENGIYDFRLHSQGS